MRHRKTKEELEQYVYLSADALVKEAATRWTIENAGQRWPEVDRVESLMEIHMDADNADDVREMLDCIEDEFKHWKEEARNCVAAVVRHDLPLTLASMELAFDGEIK